MADARHAKMQWRSETPMLDGSIYGILAATHELFGFLA